MIRVPDADFQAQMAGFGHTSAEILYRLPDHPSFLQTFFWQFNDAAPDYPRLRSFLAHWEREIEAAIHSVRVMHAGLVSPREFRVAREVGRFH